MKTKYLLMSAAFAGLFAACSQEEMFDSSAPKTDPLAGRAVVGEVQIVSDDASTRYDSENCKPTDGDAIGLYLMDEFNGWNVENQYGEMDNANHTAFEWQTNWWTMYNMVNYIQSNYGYEYVPENNTWINRASQLVEGNYIVMMPKNDVATNRRDLWREIKPVVDLKHHSTREDNYYVNRDNQFMLDYKQLHRDQKKDADGKLTMSVKFRYILTYAKFYLENQAANPFIAQKLVFKAPEGKALPTVAYVKPGTADYQGITMPNWIANNLDKQLEDGTIDLLLDNCGNFLAAGLYDENWFTQKVARGMVQYATTEEQVPYGLQNENVAYEYVFNFPDETEGGVKLEGNSTCTDAAQRVLGVSIALPAFELPEFDWTDMEVVVYGKMYDPTANDMKGAYRYGILRKLPGKDNAEFTLDKLKLWESGQDIPTANLHFDDSYFYQEEEIRVESTEDLLKLMEARLSNASTTADVDFQVYPYGNGLEITDAVVEKITSYEKKHGVEVNMTFRRDLTQGETPVILKAADCITMFGYQGVDVILDANQTMKKSVYGIQNLTNNATLTIAKNVSLTTTDMFNAEGATIVSAGTIKTANIHNEGTIELNNATVDGTITNESVLNTTGVTTITNVLTNKNTCLNCGKDKATVTVKDGVLSVKELVNWDVVVANSSIEAKTVENNGTITLNDNAAADSYVEKLENNATLNVYDALYVTTAAANAENAVITIGETGEVIVKAAVMKNFGRIFVWGELMDNVQNSGYIAVAENGHVIVNGCVEGMAKGVIDVTDANADANNAQAAKDRQYGETANHFQYTVKDNTTAQLLEAALKTRISSNNYGRSTVTDNNPITILFAKAGEITYSGIELDKANVAHVVVVEGTTLNINNHARFITLQNADQGQHENDVVARQAFEIETGATLIVGNDKTFRLNNAVSGQNVEVYVNGKLKANNHSKLEKNDGRVLIFGTGVVEIDTDAANVKWEFSDDFTGEKYGEIDN